MARRRSSQVIEAGETHDDVIAWYRAKLSEPAVAPWAGTRWPPATFGPSWAIGADGHWVLPEYSIGWDVLGFTGCWLQHGRGVPWRYTMEQARWVLWWYAVDEHGRFLFRDGVIQRLKGWGKDPLLATLCATELVGPARCVGFDGDTPIAGDVEDAWIPVVATAQAQTKTTFRLFPGLFTPEATAQFGLVVGKEMVYAYGDARMIQAVTNSASVLEGIRATFSVKNETQHWTASNNGHELADVIERNATKGAGGAARTLAATNAPDPAVDSVGQRDREAWELSEAGGSLTTGIMYDSLEAAPQAPLTAEDAAAVIETVRGDSWWLDIPRIVGSILDTRNSPARSRRWWYNQQYAAEDAWVDPLLFRRLAPAHVEPKPTPLREKDKLALFFDGSKSDDATALVGARLTDGYVVTLGLWQRPPRGRAGEGWTVPRADVDRRVSEIFDLYEVEVFYGDPSHTVDDVTQERYWDGLIDQWHKRWKDQLKVWAVPGAKGHSIMWDMASPSRSKAFTEAAMRTAQEIVDGELLHDGDRRLHRHVANAKRYPNQYGVSLWKGHRESARKVDLAVAMVGARMAMRDRLNSAKAEEKRTGKVW